jgi:endonuclease/exonuclease/phosphatase family metal-dependent hydrolase
MTHLSVMTFNLRQMDGDDGNHAWEHRKDALTETVLLHRPFLLGTQEGFAEQIAYILKHAPDYACFGQGRYGDDRDKHCKVFYDRQRLTLLECGEIWISKTPAIPGSSDWDIPRPRMITWGRLCMAQGSDLFFMNTHFPYGRGADEARRQSARLVCEKIASLPRDIAVILTGDFNAQAGGEIYAMLTAQLEDAWTAAKTTLGPEGTIHGFGRFTGGRIDWILHRGAGLVLSAETVTHRPNGMFPSDHYPVCATFDL